jgi:hypothetical protein
MPIRGVAPQALLDDTTSVVLHMAELRKKEKNDSLSPVSAGRQLA